MHNILQGVSSPHEVISAEEQQILVEWIEDNANRYWLSAGGPLRTPEEGGADIIIVRIPKRKKKLLSITHTSRSTILKCLG